MPIKLKLIRERADGLFSFVVDHPADILKWKKEKMMGEIVPFFSAFVAVYVRHRTR